MSEEDNIEKFFKNRLEPNQHFEFREGDWAKMEQKLDAAPIVQSSPFFSGKVKLVSLIILAMGLTFLLGWFAHDQYSKQETNGQNEEIAGVNELRDRNSLDQKTANATDSKDEAGLIGEIDESSRAVEKTEVPKSNKDNEATTLNATTGEPKGQITTSNDQINKPDIFDESIVNTRNTNKDTNNNPQGLYSTATEPTAPSPLSNLPENQQDLDAGQNNSYAKSGGGDNLPVYITRLYPKWDQSGFAPAKDNINPNVIFIDQAFFAQSVEEENVLNDELTNSGLVVVDEKVLSPWSVGISVSPEMNSVGFAQDFKWSNQIGLGVYYRILKNFTVSTGASYTKKIYITEGRKYKPYEGYWINQTNGLIPENIDGSCSVIDIPLNITYASNAHKKFFFEGTVGLSNYILLSENYAYEFDPNDLEYAPGGPGSYGWNTRDNSSFLLGVMNLSVGLSWNLNDRFILTGAPYFKIPLKDIGFGNIPLHSSGSYIILRYKLFRKEKALGH